MRKALNPVESARKFLCVSEALGEVLHDARMYPDPETFARLLQALTGGEATPGEVVLDPDSPVPYPGVWYQPTGGGERRFIREIDFAEALAEALAGTIPAPEVVVDVYAMTMGVRAVPGVNEAGEPGLWVDTEMERFRCTQCGQCCRSLGDAFAASADVEDVDRWEAEGRFDILEWVDLRLRNVGVMDLWIDPATGEEVTRCPWLRKVPREPQYLCRIHDTKPRHCRQYPHSKKHALMTGCAGLGQC